MSLIVNIIFYLFLIYIVTRIVKFHLLSPVYFYIIFNSVTILLSVLYFYFYTAKFSMYNLDNVSETDFLQAIDYYILALNGFLLSIIIYYDLSIKKNKKLFTKKIKLNLNFSVSIKNSTKNKIIFFHIILYLLFLLGYGKSIFIRNQYSSFESVKSLILLIKIMSFIGVFLSILLYSNYRKLSRFFFFITVLFFFGTGSRVGFLFIIIYIFLIYLITKKKTIFKKLKLTISFIFAILYLAFMITVRHDDKHGIIPYLSVIFSKGDEIVNNIVFNIYYTFIFGTFVTINTMRNALADWHIIGVNINPLLGSMVGWDKLAPSRRINIYAPFSTHGEIFRMGKMFTFTFTFVIGFVFIFFEKKIKKMLINKAYFKTFTLFLLLVLHIFYAFEYNMRSSIRYLYYSLVYLLVLYFINLFVKIIKRRY